MNKAISLDKPTDGTEDMVLGDSVPDVRAEVEFDSIADKDYQDRLHNDLWACIDDLPLDQQEVIIRHYYNDTMLTDIAFQTKKNYSMLRTLEQNALRKLRRDKRLKVYKEEIMSRAYRSSFALWENTRTSSTERAAIALCDFYRFVKWGKTAY